MKLYFRCVNDTSDEDPSQENDTSDEDPSQENDTSDEENDTSDEETTLPMRKTTLPDTSDLCSCLKLHFRFGLTMKKRQNSTKPEFETNIPNWSSIFQKLCSSAPSWVLHPRWVVKPCDHPSVNRIAESKSTLCNLVAYTNPSPTEGPIQCFQRPWLVRGWIPHSIKPLKGISPVFATVPRHVPRHAATPRKTAIPIQWQP
jgi:hypothetical protein